MRHERIDLNPLLAWREIDGQVIIISPEDSMVHELNESASFIWRQMSGGRNMKEIARLIETEYGLDASTATDDARALLEQLEAKGLLMRRRMQAHA